MLPEELRLLLLLVPCATSCWPALQPGSGVQYAELPLLPRESRLCGSMVASFQYRRLPELPSATVARVMFVVAVPEVPIAHPPVAPK